MVNQDSNLPIAECKEILSSGGNTEDVLKYLREKNYSKIQSMIIVKDLLDIDLAKVKQIIHFSTVWQDTLNRDETFHNQLEEAAKDADEKPK